MEVLTINGALSKIDSSRLGPRTKPGILRVDVIVDTNYQAPRAIVTIPSYTYSQLEKLSIGDDPDVSSYIQTAVNKITDGSYGVDKYAAPRIQEQISPVGFSVYKLIYEIIPQG